MESQKTFSFWQLASGSLAWNMPIYQSNERVEGIFARMHACMHHYFLLMHGATVLSFPRQISVALCILGLALDIILDTLCNHPDQGKVIWQGQESSQGGEACTMLCRYVFAAAWYNRRPTRNRECLGSNSRCTILIVSACAF